MLNKWALIIEYLGTNYCGWQYQSHSSSIQQEIETALFKVSQQKCRLFVAGRTDAGVHATGQVAHFESTSKRTRGEWLRGTNFFLPNDIRIVDVKLVNSKFHARYDAISREYQYYIYNQAIDNPFFNKLATRINVDLDIKVMNKATEYLIGELDFTSFRASNCQSKSKMRNILKAKFIKKGPFICFEISANAFLYHMVRNIVGSLLEVGKKNYPPNWIEKLLLQKNRQLAAATAPAHGLFLTKVNYDNENLVSPRHSCFNSGFI